MKDVKKRNEFTKTFFSKELYNLKKKRKKRKKKKDGEKREKKIPKLHCCILTIEGEFVIQTI